MFLDLIGELWKYLFPCSSVIFSQNHPLEHEVLSSLVRYAMLPQLFGVSFNVEGKPLCDTHAAISCRGSLYERVVMHTYKS